MGWTLEWSREVPYLVEVPQEAEARECPSNREGGNHTTSHCILPPSLDSLVILMTPDLCQRRVGLTHVRCWGGWSFHEVHMCLSSPPLLAVSPPTVKTRRPLLLLCCGALKPFEDSESWNWKSPLNLDEDKGKTHGGTRKWGNSIFCNASSFPH